MKVKVTLLSLIFLAALFAGCAKKNTGSDNLSTTPPATTTTPAVTSAAQTSPTTAAATTPGATDVVTTASIVNTEAAFLSAISKDGTWIIAILEDMTINKDLVLEGEFKNGKQDDAGKDILQRKLALYSQDENRTITARYTLTAPKLTVSSPQASIQHGTFKGDLYIDVNDFQLIDATVEGNVFFTKQEYKDSFKMDETSKVTGNQSVQ